MHKSYAYLRIPAGDKESIDKVNIMRNSGIRGKYFSGLSYKERPQISTISIDASKNTGGRFAVYL